MPALPAVNKVVRVDLTFTLGADTNVKNRLFFQYGGSLSAADAQTWVNTIASAWNTNMQPPFSTGLTHTLTMLTDLTSSISPQVTSSASAAGADAGATLPAGTCVVLKRTNQRRFRGGHPRLYLAGLTTNWEATSQTVAAAKTTALLAGWDAFVTAALGAPAAALPVTQVAVSYFAGFTNKTFPSGRIHPVSTVRGIPLVDPIIGRAVNPKFASQRRRNLQSP